MGNPKQRGWFCTLSPVSMGAAVGLLVLVPCLIVGGTLYVRSAHAIHEEIRNNLLRVATATSLLVDPELHKTFTDPAQESTPEYEQAIAPLGDLIERDPSFMYVYTFVEREGQIYFVLDPTPEGDADEDGVDDKSHIMEIYEADGLDRMYQSLREGRAIAETELSDDIWGTFLSAYAPVIDSNGEVVACVGIDVSADKYAGRLASVRNAGIVALVVAFVIAALVGGAAAFAQKRRIEIANEQEAASLALNELARSLDVANRQLRFASRRFEELFNLVPVSCFTFDEHGTIYEWNHESERLTGWRAHEVMQHTLFDAIVGPESQRDFLTLIELVFAGTPSLGFEWTGAKRDGTPFTVVVNAYPLVSPDGTVTGGIAACSDITERKSLQTQIENQIAEIQRAYEELEASRSDLTQTNAALSEANKQLQKLATIDGLTGVFNRRTVFDGLDRAISAVHRNARPLSVLMLDIDHFKALNDTHGHLVGDAVLRSVAAQLKSACRLQDEVGRFGGEEFLVVLPETDADEAVRAAERVRRQIAGSSVDGITVTVSVGVSTFSPATATSELLIDFADRALYEAKRAGRNRVVHSRDITEGAA